MTRSEQRAEILTLVSNRKLVDKYAIAWLLDRLYYLPFYVGALRLYSRQELIDVLADAIQDDTMLDRVLEFNSFKHLN